MRVLTLLGAGIALAGAAVMVPGALPYWARHQSLAWPALEAEVVRSRVLERTDKYGTSDWPDVGYRYVVGGKDYTGSLVRFGPTEFDRQGAEATVQVYPPGARIRAWVDPHDPTRAVLDRDRVSAQAAWKLVFGGSLLFAGLGMLATARKTVADAFSDAEPPAR